MNWFANNGDKLLAFLTAVLALAVTQHIGPPAVEEWLTFSGGVLTLAHTIYFPNGAAVPAVQLKVPDKQGGFSRLSLLATIAVVGVLGGCALLANPTFDAALQAAIDAIVAAVLTKNPAAAPIVAADAATLVQLANGNSTTSVAALEQQADAVIAASNLSVGDKAAMEAIVAGAAGLLAQEAASIPANAQSGLALVFTDIENAANLYPQAQQHAIGIRIGAAERGQIDRAANDLARYKSRSRPSIGIIIQR